MSIRGGHHAFTLAHARSEFEGPIVRLLDSAALEVAGIGQLRRDGHLTGVSISYWNRSIFEPEVIRVWSAAEFGEGTVMPEVMLELHLDFLLSNSAHAADLSRPRIARSSEAFTVDGVPFAGLRGVEGGVTAAAASMGNSTVSIAAADLGTNWLGLTAD
jgi:hypothetical protein